MKRHLALLGAGLLATAANTFAINITLVDITDPGDYPNFDPTGANVLPLLQAAANRWEDIIEDNVNVTINWRYREITGLASATILNFNGAGQPIECRINIDRSEGVRTWYFDPTPTNHSEYDLVQRIYRDLTTTQQDNWFGPFAADKPTTLLESSYRGTDNASAPANAQNGFDMFSTVIHEMGHCLGLSSANQATEDDAVNSGDFDFDIPGTWTNGDIFDVATAGTDPTENNQWAHIAAQSLMCNGCAATGLRRLPAAIDVLTVAHLGQWTTIDLPRQDFLPGGTQDWNTAGNWEGNQTPGAADDAYLRLGTEVGGGAGFDVLMSAGDLVSNLFLSSATDLFTQGNRLDVTNTATIEFDGNFPFPQIFVGVDGELETNDLIINGGELDMTGGLADIQDDLTLTADTMGREGVITGRGTVDVAGELINNGRIVATDASGPLDFVFSGTGNPWDLDGSSGDGEVFAIGGSVDFTNGNLNDTFNGWFQVADPSSINIAQPWTLGGGGRIDLNGGDPDFATFSGGLITANSGSSIEATLNCRITAPLTMAGGTIDVASNAELELDGTNTFNGGTADVASDGLLELDGPTTFNGGSYTGLGEIQVDGAATVSGATTVDVARFDMDGSSGNTVWTVNNDLTVNSSELDDGNSNFNGTLNINGSGTTLTVTGPSTWTMAGTANIDSGTTATFPSIAGVPMRMTGTTNVTGGTRWDTTTTIIGTVDLPLADDRLALGEDGNTILGGTVTGNGILRSFSDHSLTGRGTIDADIDFFGTGNLLASGGTLTLTGSFTNLGATIGTADGTGTLDVTPSWTVPAGTVLELNGGTVTGGTISNSNVIRGFGLITSNNISNNGEISADGGTLTIDTVVAPNLDGGASASVLNAVDGDVVIVDAVTDAHDDDVNIAADRTMDFQGGWTLNSGGVLNIDGGATAVNRASLRGDTVVFGTINADGECGLFGFMDYRSANVNLADGGTFVRHFGDTQISSLANFTGPGRIVQVNGGTMTLLNGAALATTLGNAGVLEIGSGNTDASAKVGSFESFSLGTMNFDLNGRPATGNFDTLVVTGNAALVGTLQVDFNVAGALVGDTWKIIDTGSLTGGFSNFVVNGLPANTALLKFEEPDGVYLKLAGAGTYVDWALGEGIPLADIDFGDNPDGDYFSNVFELFLDGDPLVPDPGTGLNPQPLNVLGVDYLSITIQRSNKFVPSDVQLRVTRSTDLQSFSTLNVVLHSSEFDAARCIETQVYRSTVPFGTIPLEFLRLEALPAP